MDAGGRGPIGRRSDFLNADRRRAGDAYAFEVARIEAASVSVAHGGLRWGGGASAKLG